MASMTEQQFKKELVDNLRLSHLAPARQEKIVELLLDIIASKVNMAVWSKLSQENREQLAHVSTGKALEIFQAAVHDFPELVETVTRQTVADLRAKGVLI